MVAQAAGHPPPVVDHAETAVGLAHFGSGTGSEHPDAIGATRRMTKAELDTCRENGIAEVVEIPVGLDLVVIAQSKAGAVVHLTLAQIARSTTSS
jgi:phosphate transport system substrate-binding protein